MGRRRDFSISRAMALGLIHAHPDGEHRVAIEVLQMTMGVLVTGSIMSPRIFISTSMAPLPAYITTQIRFRHQGVRAGAGDAHVEILSGEIVSVGIGRGEVEGTVIGGPADHWPSAWLRPSTSTSDAADEHGVAPDLDGALLLLDDDQPPLLLLARNLVSMASAPCWGAAST